MALSYGAIGTGANGTTSCTPSYPSGISAATSELFCVVTGRSNTANTAPTMPSGWTSVLDFEGGTGTWGVDTGTRRVTVFQKDTVTGSESGTVTVSLAGTTSNTMRASIVRIEKASGATVSLAASTGADTTNATSFSVTGSSSIDMAAADILLYAIAQNIDSATHSSQSLTASGLTFTRTNRSSTAVTSGNDHRHVVETATMTGSGTSAPTYSATLSASGSGVAGFLRIREDADTTAPTLTSPTATVTGATTATGTVSTNEANGTLYWLASANATETVGTVKAGSSQAVTATGVQNVSVSGLTGGNSYYLHYVHTDAASNDSARVTSAQFTTWVAPTVTTQPTNQSTTVGNTATFTASISGTPTPDLQWESQTGAPLPAAASVLGVEPLVAGVNNLTVPSGAQAMLFAVSYWSPFNDFLGASCSFATLTVAQTDPVNAAPYPSGTVRGNGPVTATGSQTLTISFNSGQDEGPSGFVYYLDGVDPADFLVERDTHAPGYNTNPSVTLDTVTGGLLVAMEGVTGTGATPPANVSGWDSPSGYTTTNNNNAGRARSKAVGSTPTETVAGNGDTGLYKSITAWSIKPITGGGSPTWENVTGGTGATTGSWTTPTATEEGVTNIRLKASNTAGTVYSDVVTRTVTPAASVGNASGALAGVSLAAPTATASGGSAIPGNASGALAGITLSAPVATASSPTSAALPKVRVGAAWVEGVVKVRAGAAWVSGALKRWNGSSWDGA